jgi:hypothetical protein
MTYPIKLKFASKEEWEAFDPSFAANNRVQIVVLGILYRTTENMVEVPGPGGELTQVPERIALDGWNVDAIVDEAPASLYPYMVNPKFAKHSFAGNGSIGMPEFLPEVNETHVIVRPAGQTLKPNELARYQINILNGKLTPESTDEEKQIVEEKIARLEIIANDPIYNEQPIQE